MKKRRNCAPKRATCSKTSKLGGQTQFVMAGGSGISRGVVGEEVPEFGKRQQELDIYPP